MPIGAPLSSRCSAETAPWNTQVKGGRMALEAYCADVLKLRVDGSFHTPTGGSLKGQTCRQILIFAHPDPVELAAAVKSCGGELKNFKSPNGTISQALLPF